MFMRATSKLFSFHTQNLVINYRTNSFQAVGNLVNTPVSKVRWCDVQLLYMTSIEYITYMLNTPLNPSKLLPEMQ
jgi:hypothetical protein